MSIAIAFLSATILVRAPSPPQPPRPVASSSAAWMSEENGVLELKLAHDEKERPDGGVLRVDSNKRLVVWEGIAGEFGCKLKVEATFEDIEDVTVTEQAGFVLELKRGKNRKLVLIPVPHAWWFKQQWITQEGGFGKNIPQTAMSNRDGSPMAVGGAAAGVGPRVKHREIPKDVLAETRSAANALRLGLGLERLR